MAAPALPVSLAATPAEPVALVAPDLAVPPADSTGRDHLDLSAVMNGAFQDNAADRRVKKVGFI